MQILEKNLPGENQRFLKTEGKFFWKLNGAWPLQSGIQTRILGKNLTNKFSDAVQAIFQWFTPFGYWPGIFQSTDISIINWDIPAFNFPIDTSLNYLIPIQLPINDQGLTDGGGDIGAQGENGLGGGGSKYILDYYDEALAPYAITGSYYPYIFSQKDIVLQDCGGFEPNVPDGQPPCTLWGYPDPPDFASAGTPSVNTTLFASYGPATANIHQQTGGGTYNYLIINHQDSRQAHIEVSYNFAPMIAAFPATYINSTLLAEKIIDGVTSNFEVPISFSVDEPLRILNAQDYLSYSTAIYTPHPLEPPGGSTKSIDIDYSQVTIINVRHYFLRKIAVP